MEKNKFNIPSRLSKPMKRVISKQKELTQDVFDTSQVTLKNLRKNYVTERIFWNEGGHTMHEVIDHEVHTRHGLVKTRIYHPNDLKNSPVIFFIHGGGFVLGNLDSHDRMQRGVAKHSNATVVAINYSLSPEAKYPVALEECVDVIKHYRQHASKYGIDPHKVGLAGDSGGANLSFASSLYFRDKEGGNKFIKALQLYYGSYGLMDSMSRNLYGGYMDGLSKNDLDYYVSLYVEKPEDLKQPYIQCFSSDLTKDVPPCFLICGELDPLVDDSILLYKILKDKGVDVYFKEYEGLLHAFMHYGKYLDEVEEVLINGGKFFKDHI